MLTEAICLDILRHLNENNTIMTNPFLRDELGNARREVEEDSLSEGALYQMLLPKYDLQEIDTAVRWLQLGQYIGRTEWGLRGPWVYKLLEKGTEVVQNGRFREEDLELLYRINPYTVFVAHQFSNDDQEIVDYIRMRLLEPKGLILRDGRADGLEEFRHTILKKIRDSRYFLCLLTKRASLDSGTFVSSVWLYQEIGAAIAYGKSPLLLVEEGIDPDFIGELQKTFEYIEFTRSNHPRVFDAISNKIRVDLQSNQIPLPAEWTTTND